MKPSRWQVVALVVALCFLSGVVGWWIGRPGNESFSDVDVGFLSDMETHHGGAIALGFAYLGREHDPLFGQMAREIVKYQSQEVAVMNGYLHQAGNLKSANADVAMDWMGLPVPISRMPGMPTTAEMNQLRASQGLDADEAFTRLMIRHHAAGVAMADSEAAHGENGNVKRLAVAMAKLQRAEISEMNSRRKALGLQPVDATALENLHAHADDRSGARRRQAA